MAYEVLVTDNAQDVIRGWNLPDDVLGEIEHFLLETLPSDPQQYLHRVYAPIDMLEASFSMDDPRQLVATYTFVFRVMFSQDETKLVIVDAGYSHQRPI